MSTAPADLPAPDPAERQPSVEELSKVIVRQHRVIQLLKEQVGAVVLANVEMMAQVEELQAQQG